MINKSIVNYLLYIAISIVIVSIFATIQLRYFIGELANTSMYTIPVIVGTIFGAILARSQQLSKQLKEAANTDSLTKLGNRRSFIAGINYEILKSKRYKSQFSVILVDVDNFKQVNDVNGHQTGDSVLYELALALSESSRSSDNCARWGGEEFIILLPHTNISHAYEKAEQLRQIIEQRHFSEVEHITCSFGVAEYIDQDDTYEEIVHRADEALYRAKDGGRNKVEKSEG